LLDQLGGALALVKADIVKDDDIALRQGRSELGFDPGFEDQPVHRCIDDKWRGQAVAPQSGNEGLGSPFAEWRMGSIPLAFGAPSGALGQLGICRRLVDKNETGQCFVEEAPPSRDPQVTGAGDLRPQLFAGREAFFYCSAQADGEIDR